MFLRALAQGSPCTWALLPRVSLPAAQLLQRTYAVALGDSSRLYSSSRASAAQGGSQCLDSRSAPQQPSSSPSASHECTHDQPDDAAVQHPASSSWQYHPQRYFSTFAPSNKTSAQDEKDDRARWKALYSQSSEVGRDRWSLILHSSEGFCVHIAPQAEEPARCKLHCTQPSQTEETLNQDAKALM